MTLDNGIITGGVALIASFLTYLGVRGKNTTDVESIVNDKIKLLIAGLQEEHNSCQKKLGEVASQLESLRGELANSRQFSFALMNLLARAGIAIPQNSEISQIYSVMMADDHRARAALPVLEEGKNNG